ncbi:ABC-three component system protein [Azospirillum sp. TSO35-2]|uniref:ABC-three component system protein n=1 Tax=Azospirillum sp. TSO35-2 TaxID=716796 RepID=UPI0011B51C60|nr:ABC-three component system protein [Azospirillum sp. TSO35-2]
MATALLKKASNSAAPGQYLGYGLQDVRLCHHLLKSAGGCSVSLEFIEDTAIHWPDGRVLLEQAKSALSGNPISDNSTELWKCFANWARLCSCGKVDPKLTKFHLYICPPKKGALVHLLHSASTKPEAAILLAEINKRVSKGKKLKACDPLISEFLSAGMDTCQNIIINFCLVSEPDPLEQIRELFRLSVFENSVEDFCSHAIGEAKNRIAALIRAGDSPMIDALEFRRRLQAFTRKYGARGLLVPTTEQPNNMQVRAILAATPIFVQQLMKVNTPDEALLRAIGDYLRSDADRTVWAADGRIVEESLNELHEGLKSHFQNVRDEVEDLMSEMDSETRGRKIYRDCIKHHEPLESQCVPSYFISGTYNMLADFATIGWHPQYSMWFKCK